MSEQKSIFSNDPSENNIDNQIDIKLQNRQEEFTNESNLTDIKKRVIDHSLSLSNDARSRLFKNKRLQAKISLNVTQSLESKLTIPKDFYQLCQNTEINPSMLQEIVTCFRTNDIQTKYKGLVGLRKILSLPTNPPFQEIIDLQLVPEFISLLGNSYPEFEYEALWCLTNISSGTSDQANSILVKGGLEKIMNLMNSKIEEVQHQAIWALGNLAGDSSKIRDSIINQGGYDRLLNVFSTTNNKNIVKQCVWALSNFFRVKPIMSYEYVHKSLDYILKSINLYFDDDELLVDACWILSSMSENYKKIIKDILNSNILPKLILCLQKDNATIVISCLRIVGNIAAGDANQTQMLLDNGILDKLKLTIFHKKKSIRKESAWIISNIASGTQRQIETLIEQQFMPLLTEVINNDEVEIQREVIWAICNLTSVEKNEYIETLFKQGIVDVICKCLHNSEAKHLAVSLEALGNLLSYGKKYAEAHGGDNPVVQKIEQLGMFDKLESLQLYPVEVVYEKVIKLLETYFDTENAN